MHITVLLIFFGLALNIEINFKKVFNKKQNMFTVNFLTNIKQSEK